jgi:hypothetical protein
MIKKSIFIILCISGFFHYGIAQNIGINPELLLKNWPATWIAVPGAPENEYGVYHFRKTFELSNKPGKFVVHVSADNRYKLFVNGELVSLGPARSDTYNWAFETVDIAPQLQSGKNTIAAVVWNFAQYAPVAQMSLNKTGFILQGNGPTEQMVNTNQTWKGICNEGYSPVIADLKTYFVVGPGDKIEAAKYPWGWEQLKFDDSSWSAVRQIISGGGKGSRDYPAWQLTPRSIPMQELSDERIPKLRIAEGMNTPAGFPEKTGNYTVPASSHVSLLIDQSYLTTAYLNLVFSKGNAAEITIKYAESLFKEPPHDKGNRDHAEGKVFFGYEDQIIADGGDHRCFTSLWWRTYRYIQLEIKTAGEPLVLHDIYGTYTGYPFQLASKFSAPEMPELDKILSVGWRTARLCAHETYMDCPYYEQLQYFGDTRIQAMVTLYNSHDDRLVRNAIDNGRQSIVADGITMSRYPTNLHQFIPSFSIWWIAMLHDYWMQRDDDVFVATHLPYVRMVLDYYERHLRNDASLSYIPYWFFTDWAFDHGEPPRMADGRSSIQDLHFLTGLQLAGDMERSIGMPAFAERYEQIATRIKAGFKAKYWDANRNLFADTPDKKSFSQHANILSILTNVVEGQEATVLMERLLQDKDLTQASIYFRYYLNMGLDKAGMGDNYLDMLDIWHTQLSIGLTTWAEKPEPSRSDCHAWGSSPNIELYRMVLGIRTAAPGFREVLIAPHLGKLRKASGCIPHPKGDICVNYQVNAEGDLKAEITLPEGLNGKFVWNGKEKNLREGKQTIEMRE